MRTLTDSCAEPIIVGLVGSGLLRFSERSEGMANTPAAEVVHHAFGGVIPRVRSAGAVFPGCPRSIGLSCDADGAVLPRTTSFDERWHWLDSAPAQTRANPG